MNSNIKILSTKKLGEDQKNLFLKSGFSLIDEDFIRISLLSFQIKTQPTLLLFTSQNGVLSVLENEKIDVLNKIPAICVGSQTRKLLEENNFKVLVSENYAEELAPIIQKNFSDEKIAFFAGNFRREILPDAMKKNNINFDEYLVYQNDFNSTKINANLDGVLFFSPSGIESYLKENKISDETCFCIGKTTAERLKNLTKNIVIADEQTIESVIEKSIEYFRRKSQTKKND